MHWQKVSNSPLNQSKTKQLYSFTKTRRFGNNDSFSSTSSCGRFYELPPLIGRSSPKAAIGFGSKTEMTQKEMLMHPSPNKYCIKSIFEDCKKGYGFRLGRDKLKQSSIFQPSFTPGPGAYSSANKKSAPEITMKSRLKEIPGSYVRSPGPGTYNLPKYISDNGKCSVSQVKNVSAPSYRQPSLSQHKKQASSGPGPGSYECKENFSPLGTFYNSKFQNSGTKSFGKAVRKTYDEGKYPAVGPGSYNAGTEFGGKDKA